MQTKIDNTQGLLAILIGDGRSLITLTGLILIGSGVFASFQAMTGYFLPHDEAYLGTTAAELCAINECRIVHFMIHDRISFGGALVAVGTLYLYLAAVPLAQGQAWAWWTLVLSGLVGFASFLSYLGYGYLDTWHGVGTLALLPIFIAGLARTRSLVPSTPLGVLKQPGVRWPWASSAGAGRFLLLITAACLMLGGGIIMTVGMTTVFVPEDLGYMRMTPADFDAVNPRLIPLIAHDRAGFGGGVMCCGLTMLLCVWCAQPSRALWQALLVTGVVGFGTAIGVHLPIGYTTLTHLAPAYLGALMFAVGITLTYPAMARHGRAAAAKPGSAAPTITT
ncbi:MAG: hypothetical protein WD009_04980 [Phycisphaeraceae bacterium]